MGEFNAGVHQCVWVKGGSMKNAGGYRFEQTIEFVNFFFYSESKMVNGSHFVFDRYYFSCLCYCNIHVWDAMFSEQIRGASKAFTISSCLHEGT